MKMLKIFSFKFINVLNIYFFKLKPVKYMTFKAVNIILRIAVSANALLKYLFKTTITSFLIMRAPFKVLVTFKHLFKHTFTWFV